MQSRLPGSLARGAFAAAGLLPLALGLVSCSGGSPASVRINSVCGDASADFVCLEACSLGCSTAGCQITDIAQNETIVLRFSQPMDPATVNNTTVRLRTATGEEPVGTFLVNNNLVEFVPQVLTVGSQSFFGFRAGEAYTLLVNGGGGTNTVRSTAGDALLNPLQCTLRVTRGIVDLNGVSPSAEMVVPSVPNEVAPDSVIQLRFNELIDLTPFSGTTSTNAPIVFSAARSINTTSGRICSPESTPLSGSMRFDTIAIGPYTVVTFTPSVPLPNNSCIRISITDRVQDLSGRAAQFQSFEFRTRTTALVETSRTEEFDDETFLDAEGSAATWAAGRATFAQLGGDGRHGPFSLSLCTQLANQGGFRVFQLDTAATTIPPANTLGGAALTVTDGKFFFTDMVIPADVRLVFTGTQPPQIAVRGRLQIDGQIEVSGETMPYFENPTLTQLPGQAGGRAGIGGGAGGAGASRCIGLGVQPANQGSDGANVRVGAGHAYAAQVVATGGRGSRAFPADGLRASLVFPPPLTGATDYVLQTTSGGGGGGLVVAGAPGRAISNQADPSGNGQTRLDFLGPDSLGGVSFPIYAGTNGTPTLLHYLVGGSGGGGAGSHAALMSKVLAQSPSGNWAPGCGGGGGGGAVALRAGRSLTLGANARIAASGGSAGISPTTQTPLPQAAPGGGGSGGSIVLQCSGATSLLGTLDVRGGNGGRLARSTSASPPPRGGAVVVEGGNGSQGVLRVEVPGTPTLALVPNAQPAATTDNVGTLVDTDTRVGFLSKWYSTGLPLGPEYVRYELRAWVNNTLVVFSDDPAVGVPARPGTSPLEVWFQGVRLDLDTGAIDQQDLLSRVWRTSVGASVNSLALDARNAFRFQILLDRSVSSDVEVESLKIVYRF